MFPRKKDFFFTSNSSITFLDNANTTQKPKVVLDKMMDFYMYHYASAHRGNYPLSIRASDEMEAARLKVCRFIGASCSRQVIFTSGATHSLNLVARGLDHAFSKGDRILISRWEHTSNVLPWIALARRLELCIVYLDDWKDLYQFKGVKLVCCNFYSHVTGFRAPVEIISQFAQDEGALFLLDATQAISHSICDVSRLKCDFMVFSSHKMYGPNGVGVLYLKKLNLEPSDLGGGQVGDSMELTANYPDRMEAGTHNLPAIVGLGAAVDYLESLGMKEVSEYLEDLKAYAVRKLEGENLNLRYGEAPIISIKMPNCEDVAYLLGAKGICLRAGYLCSHLLKEGAMLRISLAVYNCRSDLDKLALALNRIIKLI